MPKISIPIPKKVLLEITEFSKFVPSGPWFFIGTNNPHRAVGSSVNGKRKVACLIPHRGVSKKDRGYLLKEKSIQEQDAAHYFARLSPEVVCELVGFYLENHQGLKP
jgi:hypothetical protein